MLKRLVNLACHVLGIDRRPPIGEWWVEQVAELAGSPEVDRLLRRDPCWIPPVTEGNPGRSNNLPEDYAEALRRSKVVVYASSRNNYAMLEGEILRNVDFEGYPFINVDDVSEDDQKELGREICTRHGVPFLDNKERGLQWALKTVIDYLDDIGSECEWLVHITHDCRPAGPAFFSRLNGLVEIGRLRDFGCVGFNVLDFMNTRPEIQRWKNSEDVCGILGRAVLTKVPSGKFWYQPKILPLPWDIWGRPFMVDCVVDTCLAINRQLFSEHVSVSSNYHLHVWADDVCLQFLVANVPNIVIPDIYVFNCQFLKAKYRVPIKSDTATRDGDTYHYGPYLPYVQYWCEKWGWDRGDKEAFQNVRKRYEGTLLPLFYDHDVKKGPLKYVDL